MSKSLRNYPDPMGVFDRHGADAMRWYLMSSPILRGGDFAVTEDGIRDTVRQVLLPLWNSWYFLSLYANAAGVEGRVDVSSDHVMDRYVLAKLRALVERSEAAYDRYDLFAACAEIRGFLDVLTNWYIRRSRDRFWEGDRAAIDTLHSTLHVLARVAAPLLPLVTEHVYRGLTGERSVHLADWPDASALASDDDLVAAMDAVRGVCSATLSLRKAHGRRVRLPLARLTVAMTGSASLRPYVDIVADEVNVREVHLRDDVASVATLQLQVRPGALGPRLGSQTQRVIAAAKRGEWSRGADGVAAGGVALHEGEYEMRLVPTAADPDVASAALEGIDGVVALDVRVTPELEAEGAARDLVRVVQQRRRELGLHVSDRISLSLGLPADVAAAIAPHAAMIAAETLAARHDVRGEVQDANADLDGVPIHVGVERLP